MVYKQNNNSIMQNSMMLLTIFIPTGNTIFRKISSRRSKSLVQAEIWYLHLSEHVEFNGDALFSCFSSKIPFSDKFSPESQNYQFKLKFSTYNNSNMKTSIPLFTFFVIDQKLSFWANQVQKLKIISLSLNLVPTLIRICRIQW